MKGEPCILRRGYPLSWWLEKKEPGGRKVVYVISWNWKVFFFSLAIDLLIILLGIIGWALAYLNFLMKNP